MTDKIVAIVRGAQPEHVSAIANALMDEGIDWVEVSLSDESLGLECIRALASECGEALHLGVGTVINVRQVDLALEAGARYIITPGWDRELVRYIRQQSIDVIPGVCTPSEVMQATNEGVRLLKLFPAGWLGAKYIKALLGPFPNVKLMAVGGVNLDSAPELLQAGCSALGVGSDLVPRGATAKDLDRIRRQARAYLKLVEREA